MLTTSRLSVSQLEKLRILCQYCQWTGNDCEGNNPHLEPPKPEPKEPGKPQPQPSLPNTGTAASMLPVVGMILGLLSLAGLRKSKEN